MAETFFIRTKGGPHPGNRVVDSDHYPWPLPGFLNDSGGKYAKVSESQAPPQEEGSHLVRAAEYEWMTDEQLLRMRGN